MKKDIINYKSMEYCNFMESKIIKNKDFVFIESKKDASRFAFSMTSYFKDSKKIKKKSPLNIAITQGIKVTKFAVNMWVFIKDSKKITESKNLINKKIIDSNKLQNLDSNKITKYEIINDKNSIYSAFMESTKDASRFALSMTNNIDSNKLQNLDSKNTLSSLSITKTNILKLTFFLIFCLINSMQAAKYQFFLGLGNSINAGKLETSATNQFTRNTSTVNETGNLFYTNTQHGKYDGGNVKDITSGYTGLEVTLDKAGIFTIRGYVSASFSNSVDFGKLDRNSIHDGNMRRCNQGEMPGINTQCWRDEFYNSGTAGCDPNITIGHPEYYNCSTRPVPFNPNPGFSDTIANNAFMLTYGVGIDVGVNLPISFLWKKMTKYKMIGFRVGVYGGVGYEFSTYSLGKFDNRTYNNTTSGADNTWNPDGNQGAGAMEAVPGTTLNENDTLYISGAGMYARAGISLYFTDNLRADFGLKIPITFAGVPSARSQKWYLKEHILSSTANPYTQQLLIQNYEVKIGTQWHFSVNVLF